MLSLLYHPKMLDFSTIPQTLGEKEVKLESNLLLHQLTLPFQSCPEDLSVPDSCMSIFSAMLKSVSKDILTEGKNIQKQLSLTLQMPTNSVLWNYRLDDLTVQSKFRIVELQPHVVCGPELLFLSPIRQIILLVVGWCYLPPTPQISEDRIIGFTHDAVCAPIRHKQPTMC